jgi:hypothetical protein
MDIQGVGRNPAYAPVDQTRTPREVAFRDAAPPEEQPREAEESDLGKEVDVRA